MPILDTNISKEILDKISSSNFLNIFKNEYINTFDEFQRNGDCILCNRVTYFTCGTIGWDEVLKETCNKTNNIDIYNYYSDLDFHIMEKFNNLLIELLEKNNLFLVNYSLNKCNKCFLDD